MAYKRACHFSRAAGAYDISTDIRKVFEGQFSHFPDLASRNVFDGLTVFDDSRDSLDHLGMVFDPKDALTKLFDEHGLAGKGDIEEEGTHLITLKNLPRDRRRHASPNEAVPEPVSDDLERPVESKKTLYQIDAAFLKTALPRQDGAVDRSDGYEVGGMYSRNNFLAKSLVGDQGEAVAHTIQGLHLACHETANIFAIIQVNLHEEIILA